MANYQLSPLAEVDLKETAASTISSWGPEQARVYLTNLHQKMLALVDNSELGRQRDEILPGAKCFPTGKHVIFYRLSANGIEVARVLHQRMDIQTQFGDDL